MNGGFLERHRARARVWNDFKTAQKTDEAGWQTERKDTVWYISLEQARGPQI